MNTFDVKEFALAEYRKDKTNEDNWVNYSPDFDLNIYLPEHWTDSVFCSVYPVIDGVVDSSREVYHFSFPRESMNTDELLAYVEANRVSLIAEALKYEEGVTSFWGEIAMSVFHNGTYSKDRRRRVMAYPLTKTSDGMMEANPDLTVWVADITF